MNAFEKLKMEFDGISGTIKRYTRTDAVINNNLKKLQEALEEHNYETLVYNLDCILEWYDNRISEILGDSLASHKGSHTRNYAMLKTIRDEIKEQDCQGIVCTAEEASCSSHKLVFLSHQSQDKKYGDALRNFFVGLGLRNDQLIYSSHPMHKIPMDVNIYDYLRENINSEIFMIILWSDTYLESPACLNEMGAAWVVQTDYTNIYVPTFSFGNPKYHECAVDTRKMGAVLNGDAHCKASMIELKNKIQEMFNLPKNEQNEAYLLDCFIAEITEG